jgi:hypothetical protein
MADLNSRIEEKIKSLKNDSEYDLIGGFIDTITFGKSIPFYIIKCVVLSLIMVLVANLISWVYVDNAWINITYSLFSIPLLIFMIISDSFSTILGKFIESLENAVLGNLVPIDSLYKNIKEDGGIGISKKKFTGIVLRKFIFPNIIEYVPTKFIKKKAELLFDKVLEATKEDESINSSDDVNNSETVEKIKSLFEKYSEKVSKPFFWSMGTFFFTVLILGICAYVY